MADLRDKVKEFAEIAALVPEHLQSTCFEVLLRDYLASIAERIVSEQKKSDVSSEIPPAATEAPDKSFEETAKTQADITHGDLHVKARKFMEKHSVSLSDLNNLFYKEGQSIMPLYEDLKTTRLAETQIRITLLQALRTALAEGEFIADVEVVRTECRDRKSYDGTNFAANFNNNGSLFDFDKYTKGITSVRLSEDGKKELAQLIKELQ
jgi:hypothetical protein